MPQFPAIGAFGAFRAEDELADRCFIYAVGGAHEFTNIVDGKPPAVGGTGAGLTSDIGLHGGAVKTNGTANGFFEFGSSADFATGTDDFAIAVCAKHGTSSSIFPAFISGHAELLTGNGGNPADVVFRLNGAGGQVSTTATGLNNSEYNFYVFSRSNGINYFYCNGRQIQATTVAPLSLTATSGLTIGKRGSLTTYYAIDGVAMVGYWRRGLSTDEMLKLCDDPFLLARPKERTYIAAAGGAHAATGVLVGQGSTVTGTAARTRAHASTGILTGPGSTIAGTATVKRIHASTGALTGQIGSITGSAARASPGPVTHAATGILTGQGSAISGLSARIRIFSATGALVGQGAVIAGTATRAGPAATHNATGSLIGQGSIITGSALNGSSTWTITPETVSNSFTITGGSITSDFTVTNETISDVWIIT